jgi:hypothetical protein
MLDLSESRSRFVIVAARHQATLEPSADAIERLPLISCHDDQLIGDAIAVLGVRSDRSFREFLVQRGLVALSVSSLGARLSRHGWFLLEMSVLRRLGAVASACLPDPDLDRRRASHHAQGRRSNRARGRAVRSRRAALLAETMGARGKW